MSFAAPAPPSPAAIRSLPPLSGRLLLAYRCAWLALAVGAVAALAWLALRDAMDPLVFALRLAKSAVLLGVSLILFRRRRGDGVAALLSLALLLWVITSSFDLATGDLPTAILVGDRLRFLLFALALLLFPAGIWSPAWTRQVAALSISVFLLGVAEAVGAAPTRLFLPLAILCVLASLAALLVRYRSAAMAERQQVKWVALGLSTGIALILAARAGAALSHGRAGISLPHALLEGLFQLGIIAVAVGFLVSLLRYRLYDAESVISRSAAYAGLTLALIATFTASEVFIEGLGQNYLGAEIGDLAGALAAGIAAMLLAPLHNRLTAWAERHFQRDLLGLRMQVPDLMAALSGGASLARLGSVLLPHIEAAVHSARITLVVDGRVVASRGIAPAAALGWFRRWQAPADPGQFDAAPDDDFPLRMALRCPLGSVRAWLLLGPRPDGSCHGQDELDALQAIAAPVQRALFAVAERQQAEARERAARNRMARSLRALEKRLSQLERRSPVLRG